MRRQDFLALAFLEMIKSSAHVLRGTRAGSKVKALADAKDLALAITDAAEGLHLVEPELDGPTMKPFVATIEQIARAPGSAATIPPCTDYHVGVEMQEQDEPEEELGDHPSHFASSPEPLEAQGSAAPGTPALSRAERRAAARQGK